MGGRPSNEIVIARWSGAAVAYLVGIALLLGAPFPGVVAFKILTAEQPPPTTKEMALAIGAAATGVWILCVLILIGLRAAFGKAALYVNDGRLVSLAPFVMSVPVSRIVQVQLGPSGPFEDAPLSIFLIMEGGVRKRVSVFLATQPTAAFLAGFERAGIRCAAPRSGQNGSPHDSAPGSR